MRPDENLIQILLQRHLREKANGSFFMPNFHFLWHEADLIYLTKSGYSTEFEIKISRSDFFNDKKKTCGKISKAEYLRSGKGCNYFYYVVPKGLIKLSEVPEYAGLIEIDFTRSYNHIDYVKLSPKLKKEKTEWIKEKIFEKAYYRYEDKIILPNIRRRMKEFTKTTNKL